MDLIRLKDFLLALSTAKVLVESGVDVHLPKGRRRGVAKFAPSTRTATSTRHRLALAAGSE